MAIERIAERLAEFALEHDRWRDPPPSLRDLMQAEELTDEQVHCSDFALKQVTGTKQGWTFEVVYYPHLAGQPPPLSASVHLDGTTRESEVEFHATDNETLAYPAWTPDRNWDARFRAQQRRQLFVSAMSLLALSLGLTAGLTFAILLQRLRRRLNRDGALSGGHVFAAAAALIAISLGAVALPEGSVLRWTAVAALLPALLALAAVVGRWTERRLSLRTFRFAAGETTLPTLEVGVAAPSCRSSTDVADGLRISWSTNRFTR